MLMPYMNKKEDEAWLEEQEHNRFLAKQDRRDRWIVALLVGLVVIAALIINWVYGPPPG